MEGLLIGFLYAISIVWIILGALLVVAPGPMKDKFFSKLLKNVNLKKISVIPIIIGILLLLSAPYNMYAPLVTILGILAIIKGILTIVATEMMERITDWWLQASNNVCRIWGIAIIIIGAIVITGI